MARSEWATLPIQEVAAYPRCSRVRASPLRRLPRGAPDLVGTRWIGAMVSLFRLRTRTLGVGPRNGWRLLPECARTSAFASANCTVPAAVPFARAHSCSLSVSASMVLPWKSPHRVRLALSGCRENRKRHLRSRRYQTADSGAPGNESSLSIVQNTRSLSTLAFV